MSRIMVVAGGEWQVPLIKKAKEMGHYVINTNLYEDSIGFKYADIGIVADVLDKEKNLEVARKFRPEAVITDQSDIAVPTVAYICEKMNLPGIGVEKADLFTNKFMMREFCRSIGFPSPNYRLCDSFDDVLQFSRDVGFPFIIKPTCNQSSRGVNKVNSVDEIEPKYLNSLDNSKDGKVLAEEFIGGIELTVEGFKTANTHISLAVSRKEHLKENPAVACRLFYSNNNVYIDYDRLRNLNNYLVEKMELPFGITHAEYKYYNGEFYLIEIAARGGGTKISSHIVPLLTGINTNELLIKMALGEDLGEIKPVKKPRCAVLEFFVLNSGKVREIKGIDEILSYKNVVDLGLNFGPGDFLYPPTDDRSRPGFFIAFEDDEPSLNHLIDKIKITFEVVYE